MIPGPSSMVEDNALYNQDGHLSGSQIEVGSLMSSARPSIMREARPSDYNLNNVGNMGGGDGKRVSEYVEGVRPSLMSVDREGLAAELGEPANDV